MTLSGCETDRLNDSVMAPLEIYPTLRAENTHPNDVAGGERGVLELWSV